MKRQGVRHTTVRGFTFAMVLAVALPALLLVAAASPAPAAAATVSGTVKGGAGYRILLVQAKGTTRQMTITKASGAFSIPGVKLGNASLQLVNADGSYYGPVVLKATSTKAYAFIKGAGNLKLGTVKLKAGYALTGKIKTGRYQTLAAYTAKAVKGKPIGVGKLGRVKTANPMGLRGAGADLDLDGVISAFDIDDNGNRIIDNTDRTRRGGNRPTARGFGTVSATARAAEPPSQELGPPPISPEGSFFSFSQLWMTGAQQVNANIATIADLDGLIARLLPTHLKWGGQFPSGDSARLDGLGNSYIREHTVDGVTYPLVNDDSPPTYTVEGLLNLPGNPRHPGGGGFTPGALPSEIAAGDSYVLVTTDGVRYPATLNFVFNTAPAVKSVQFDDAPATEVTYDENGVFVADDGRPTDAMQFTVPKSAKSLTLTIWRPQRKATVGEPSSAGGWVDMGGLWYGVILNGPPQVNWQPVGTSDIVGAITPGLANGSAMPVQQWEGGVMDPAADQPSNAANTISFTLDLEKCCSDWSTLPSGAWFGFGISASTGYADKATIGLWFTLE